MLVPRTLRPFVPVARGGLETLGKMIELRITSPPQKRLAVRIVDLLAGFHSPQTFIQSIHGTLCYKPTGVLVETKVDIRRRAEGKAQLGIWLAG